MAFTGKYPTRSKIVIDNKVLEQVSQYCYLGCDISFKDDSDVERKIGKFQSICGNISRTLGKKARKETIMKFYRMMAAPVLLYGSESWITTKSQESRLQAAEMRFLRRTKGCDRRDHIRNEDIRRELGAFNMNEKLYVSETVEGTHYKNANGKNSFKNLKLPSDRKKRHW
ncbi:uncharacterized protein LOC120356339 [Nilaparvata lugens]|uniref:uncharacterized protein LOC120356339 n=1 Tax=Nilaparvata lugens TaxID=108931 RepID=UPI00193D4D3F|nr:uncharacterized protein LOC120356339 [Nilaparvata lugens]